MTKNNNNNPCRFPIKKAVVLWGILVALFVIGILLMNKHAKSLKHLAYDIELDTTFVVNPVNNRGGLFYDNYEFVVNSGSELVENKQGYDDWNFYRKTNPSSHALSHLPGPYYMYKASYNDTIVVIKDGYVLKFKMPVPDSIN